MCHEALQVYVSGPKAGALIRQLKEIEQHALTILCHAFHFHLTGERERRLLIPPNSR
jgi:hypothetical protein